MDAKLGARALAGALGAWRAREPAYEALADGIRLLCLDNRVPPHTALPAERELASVLGVSRATVAAAYRSLRASEHIVSLRGSGSVTLPLARRAPVRTLVGAEGIDLQQASPAAWPGLAAAFAETAADAATIVSRPGYDIVGSPELRERLAAAYTARGLPTSADDILVTNGAQHAIHLVTAALVGRGDRVVIESPTYPHAAEAIRSGGARLTALPVSTEDGWDLERATQAFERTRPVAAYLMPWFQNPTGRTMTEVEATTLRALAQRVGTRLIIDETTADLSFDGTRAGEGGFGPHAIRIGSLGKTVWGGLRVGWVRADESFIRRLVALRPHRDLGTPEFEQAVATRLLDHMPEILAQRARLLREGRDAAADALRAHLPDWRVPEIGGGVSLWVRLDAPLSGALVMAARARGVLLSAGPRFAVDGGHDRHLRVPITGPAEQLRGAVAVLGEVWPVVRRGAPTRANDPVAAIV